MLRIFSRLIRLVIVMFLAIIMTGCSLGRPGVDFLSPVNGAQVQVGQAVPVRISATSNRDLASVEFWVDGELYQTDQNALGSKSYLAVMAWTPNRTGEHILAARAVDSRGRASQPVRVVVTAMTSGQPPAAEGGSPPVDNQPPGSAVDEQPPAEDESPSVEGQSPAEGEPPPEEDQPPVEAEPPSGEDQPPPPGAPVIDYFYFEAIPDQPGCYYLFWDLHGATAAFLNGQAVVAPGSSEVCPEASTVYRLEAVNEAGTAVQELLLEGPTALPEEDEQPPSGGESGQADLIIRSLAMDPASPRQGEAATALVEVYNQGSAPAGHFRVQWQAGDAPGPGTWCDWDVNGLLEGQGQHLDCAHTYESSGSLTMRAIADIDGEVNEADEANNSLDQPIQVQQPAAPEVAGQPDLVVTSLEIHPPSPTQGETTRVVVVVANQGQADSDSFSVQWWATPQQVGCSWEVEGLAAQAEEMLQCPYTYASGGKTYGSRVIVDDDQHISEIDEGNNSFSVAVPVLRP